MTKKLKLILVIVPLFFLSNCMSEKEKAKNIARFMHYYNSESAINMVKQEIAKNDAKHGDTCKDNYNNYLLDLPKTLTPITFSKNSLTPKNGAWKYHLDMKRCGKTTIHNVYMIIENNGPPLVIESVRGNTQVSWKEIGKYKNLALKGSMIAQPYHKCLNKNQIFIADSYIISGNSNGDRKEEWIVRRCNKEIPIIFKFSGDKEDEMIGHPLVGLVRDPKL